MSRLLLYNPENDLALASNALSYTPTAAALAMRQSGVLLPLWWSEPGDQILVPDSMMHKAESMCAQWNLPGTPVSSVSATTAMPWGWSRSVKRELIALGVAQLPSDSQIQTLRNLSHRRISIELLRLLNTDPEMLPMEFSNPVTALEAINRIGNSVLKMPWSGSGRGVFHSNHISRTMLEKTVRDIIHRQGSIIIEHELHKIRDFATLFYSDGRQVTYRGLSLFITDTHGHYQGNHLMSQPRLTSMLGIDVSQLAHTIASHLSSIVAPHYTGWLGVDMMLYTDSSGQTLVWPCVEINLRLTMGVLALYCAQRIIPPDATAQLIVTRQASNSQSLDLSPVAGPIQYLVTNV